MEHKHDQQMKIFFDHHADDIAGFLGGSGFSLCFAGTMLTSLTHVIVVGLIGGACGVIGKEVGTWMVKTVKNLFK